MISEIVYDGPQFQNKINLEQAINDAIWIINSSRRHHIIYLYESIVTRLTKILCKKANLCKNKCFNPAAKNYANII